jgi:hypothetical protein
MNGSTSRSAEWVRQIFRAKAARTGGIVRRSIASVARNASQAELLAEVERRDFHMVISGGQYVIMCNPGSIKLVR